VEEEEMAIMEMTATLPEALSMGALPLADQDELARGMRVRRFKADEVLYHRGDPAAYASVVQEGLVKAMLFDDDGRVALVALHGPGELFGELALFTDAPRESTVIAVVPTTVAQMTRDVYWRLLERHPKACGPMFAHLGRTIQRLEERYEDLVFQDVPGRLAKYLLEIDQQGTRLPITQDDLAAAIGSTRVTVNKLLADLERRGVISVDRRRIDVMDRAALEQETRR
jgi:CRP/FNR family cyclic AMP-dependent transcriptional regulator